MSKSRYRRILLTLAMLSIPLISSAEVPPLIDYQGKLSAVGGGALDTVVSMTFAVYDDSSKTTQLWTETHPGVTVTASMFHLILGGITPIPATVFSGGVRWMAIAIGSDPELDGMLQLVSVPYAMRAGRSDTATVALSADNAHWLLSSGDLYYLSGDVGIGTPSPTQKLEVNGNVQFNKNQGELILRTPAHNDPGRFSIRWDNNLLAPFLGNDSSDQFFGFYTDWSANRTHSAHIKIHGSSSSSWGRYLELTHDGTDGRIRTDVGDLLLNPNGFVGIGADAPAYALQVHGLVYSDSGGFRFPDGSVQTTAAFGGGGLTLPYAGTLTSSNPGFKITNLGVAPGIQGFGGTVGVRGESNTIANRTTYGLYGTSISGGTSYGVYGTASNYGVYGKATTSSVTSYGVFGKSASSGSIQTYGIYGQGNGLKGVGVYGTNTTNGTYGYLGNQSYGVYGFNAGNGYYGYLGGNYGVYGEGGVYGHTSGSSYAMHAVSDGSSGTGIFAMGGTNGYAADFRGNVRIFSRATNTQILELGEGLDYAEGFDVTETSEVSPGTVLVIDTVDTGHLTIAREPYDTRVAGIVAGANGLGSGVRLGTGQFDHDVALAGRVYCKVDASYGAVKPGDLLTTSPTPGYAMVVRDRVLAQGAILGKAMEPLESGLKGEILVLVSLQ